MSYNAKDHRIPGGVYYKGVQLTLDNYYIPQNLEISKKYWDKKMHETGNKYVKTLAVTAKRVANAAVNLMDVVEEAGTFSVIRNHTRIGPHSLADVADVMIKLKKSLKSLDKPKRPERWNSITAISSKNYRKYAALHRGV